MFYRPTKPFMRMRLRSFEIPWSVWIIAKDDHLQDLKKFHNSFGASEFNENRNRNMRLDIVFLCFWS